MYTLINDHFYSTTVKEQGTLTLTSKTTSARVSNSILSLKASDVSLNVQLLLSSIEGITLMPLVTSGDVILGDAKCSPV